MMGKIVEDMAGVIIMAAVGMREQQKQRRRRHGRNKGQWEINFRGKCGGDEYGGGDVVQRIWRFWDNHDVVGASCKR